MGELLIKPYEISVWEDKLTQDGFKEKKLAVIGSNTMTGLNKVYDPVFTKNVNGEKTLTFSLKYKYFDPYSGNEEVVNPFAALLINERKVKLKYDDEWYEFIIKDHSESSEEYTWTYTCTDAFVLELAKQGYNITFDSELNNNQGTAEELAKKALENTDWQVGQADILKQFIAEPVYKAQLVGNANIINASGSSEAVPAPTTNIYLFYSYVKNQNGKNIQFIIRNENKKYVIDDNNVIIDTNFRITDELVFKDNQFVDKNDTPIITIGEIETRYQVNRLAYNQLTTYDPVMERTVERFDFEDTEVYKYTDYEYTTSNVVTNFISNGENFNALEDGTLQGWNPYTDQREGDGTVPLVKKLELLTYPELGTGKSLADLSTLSQIEGFLKVTFNDELQVNEKGNYCNLLYNSGLEDNWSTIGSISKGDKFVFRWKARMGGLTSELSTNQVKLLRMMVAQYTQDEPTRFGYYYKHVRPEDVILKFEGPITELNNIISGGYIRTDTVEGKEVQNYVIDDVVQTPSTKYLYKDKNDVENKTYLWNAIEQKFEVADNTKYVPYFYVTATAQKSVSQAQLNNTDTKIGIFLYSTNTALDDITYYIQDVQFTRFVPDGADPTKQIPVLIGNVPVATSNPVDYYYVKPKEGTAAEDVETFRTIKDLAQRKGVSENSIVPKYNENSEKTLSISVSQSNCFDILQTIGETFECWVDLVVDHDSQGYITSNSSGKPNKFVYLREYVGKDNYAGFKYGINLQSIERTVNSDEIVTKLIVDQSQSDYVEEGYVSIADAPSNASGESYILNFDYYYNQGLLDKEQAEENKNEFITDVAAINKSLKEKEQQRRDSEAALTALESKRNVYTELIDTAKKDITDALADFEACTKESYEDYRKQHEVIEEDKQYTEDETLLDILGQIYVCSATINNYSGLLTTTNQEYWKIRKELRGSEDYNVRFWRAQDDNEQWHVFVDFSDYLVGASFELGENTYTVTVSRKYFDLTSNLTSISFFVPSGYSIVVPTEEGEEPETAPYTIGSPKTFTIKSDVEQDGIEDEIEKELKRKEEIINEFNNKYSRFIQEGTWNSTNYIDSELYYLDALQTSHASAHPQISYTINVVEISELEGYQNYKFDTGDKTYVEDTEFFGWANVDGVLTPAREEVIVSEVEWHLDSPDENVITVQNYKTRFEDLFQRISATVQTVQFNEATYAKISSLLDSDGTINQDVLLTSLNRISGQSYNLTSDGSIIINGDNILIRNLTSPPNLVKINSEGIRISSDGGQSWTTALDGQGINIGTVYTGTLNTNNVIIGNRNNPSFRWDKSGISAYKYDSETYIKTSDTTIDPVKQYYTRDAVTGEYVRVDEPRVEDLDDYYESTTVYDLQTFVRYDQYGLYGIKEGGSFKASSLEDVKDKAHFAVTWDGFFIKNSYPGGGRVEITSDNDFRVMNIPEGKTEEQEKIKIGALEWGKDGQGKPITSPDAEGATAKPTLYGIRIKNDVGAEVMKTDDDGDITITGTINATGGNFSDLVTVGKNTENAPHIIIDGTNASIKSSNYSETAGYGWMINKDGDAVFNNITARGAIKTAVFEYAEIQAVGGIFIFRPSSTIKDAEISGEDLVLTVEKPLLFKVGQWCKISNYANGNDTEGGEATNPDVSNILLTNGLTHVYPVASVNSKKVTLTGAKQLLTDTGKTKEELAGGALVDMGNKANGDGEVGTSNYGIGINSSDNTVNLPRRAISLFETVIDETKNPKVSYRYRGILGTLPESNVGIAVDNEVYQYMQNTQGIYTDNMYIGDDSQYVAFYEDDNGKQLKIKASQIMFEVSDPQPDEDPWKDIADIEAEGVPGPAGKDGEDAIYTIIDSSAGNVFINGIISTILRCYVYKGGIDITHDNNYIKTYTWKKINIIDGSEIPGWTPTPVPLEPNAIRIGVNDVNSKAVFQCTVNVEEA